jgi:uncharacterized phiE125 gp8 family phage protein
VSIALIQGPVAEPITLNDAKLQLGFGPMQDSDRAASQILNDKLRAFIVAARQDCENWTNRAFITQRWILRRDSFPGHNLRYEWNGYPQIELPKPPFQSVESFQYIDVSGTPQTLTQDATFGTNPTNPQYGYQLERGSETQPGRLLPPFARPWPPTRMVPANVIVQFRCGYGGPITVSMTASSALLTVAPGSVPASFNADDAPLLPGETGLPISIPGAGPDGATLNTFIASVNPSTGQATLAAAASTAVTNVQAWAGQQLPAVIPTAIKMLVEFYYDHGGCEDVPMPRVIESLLEPYRNFVS